MAARASRCAIPTCPWMAPGMNRVGAITTLPRCRPILADRPREAKFVQSLRHYRGYGKIQVALKHLGEVPEWTIGLAC